MVGSFLPALWLGAPGAHLAIALRPRAADGLAATAASGNHCPDCTRCAPAHGGQRLAGLQVAGSAQARLQLVQVLEGDAVLSAFLGHPAHHLGGLSGV
jgi:hypothetical protein